MWGNIDGLSLIQDSFLSEEPLYTIIAPSDVYTISGSSTIALVNETMSVDITSETPFTVSEDLRTIRMECEEDNPYAVMFTTFENIYDQMSITGSAYSPVTIAAGNDGCKVEGAKTVKAEATVSGHVSTLETDMNPDDSAYIGCYPDTDGVHFQISTLSYDDSGTPHAAISDDTTLPEREQTPAPEYDLSLGSYSEAQTLTLTSNDETETVIYYTTDGTEPTKETGLLYSSPIEIRSCIHNRFSRVWK